MAATRPFGVTLVGIIAWVTGALGIVQGIFALLIGAVTAGLVALLLGIIVIAVSLGLFRGSPVARVLVMISFVLNIASSLYLMLGEGRPFWAQIGNIVLPLIGVLLLSTRRANAFFSR